MEQNSFRFTRKAFNRLVEDLKQGKSHALHGPWGTLVLSVEDDAEARLERFSKDIESLTQELVQDLTKQVQ